MKLPAWKPIIHPIQRRRLQEVYADRYYHGVQDAEVRWKKKRKKNGSQLKETTNQLANTIMWDLVAEKALDKMRVKDEDTRNKVKGIHRAMQTRYKEMLAHNNQREATRDPIISGHLKKLDGILGERATTKFERYRTHYHEILFPGIAVLGVNTRIMALSPDALRKMHPDMIEDILKARDEMLE